MIDIQNINNNSVTFDVKCDYNSFNSMKNKVSFIWLIKDESFNNSYWTKITDYQDDNGIQTYTFKRLRFQLYYRIRGFILSLIYNKS